MQLLIDIGNSNVVFGLYDNGWVATWRLATKDEAQQRIIRSIEKHLSGKSLTAIGISSVVPVFTEVVLQQVKLKYGLEPFIVSKACYPQLDLEVLQPDQIGTDLVCNAVAATALAKDNVIVVDFGTALTFTVVQDNKIAGVNIVPGLAAAVHALSADTAKLHDIELKLPKSVIGHDTTTAIQSGILWGYVGLVERMIERIEEELDKKFKIVATGGLNKVLTPLNDRFDYVEVNLTLDGIRLMMAK